MQTNNNSMDATKRTGVDAKNAAYTSANTVLPYWDNNEINKRLEEHTKLLTEWEELLNKTGGPEVTSISQQDATRHILLKRKLHESLGVMARIVQNQLKMKKPAADSVPTGAAPLAPNASVPNQSTVYNQQSQGNSFPSNQQNMNTLPPYQQQTGMVDYSKQMGVQQVPLAQDPSQQPQPPYNNGYQPNAYVPNATGQYYTYTPTVNNGAVNGQMQGQMQGQGMAQQMYIPNYNNANYASTMGTVNTTTAQNFNPNVNTTAYTSNNVAVSNTNGNTGYPNMVYSAYPATTNMYTAPGQGMPQTMNANNTMPSTTSNATPVNNAYAYNTTSNMYPNTMLQQMPTSYYGNSSIGSMNNPSLTSATNVTNNTQSTGNNNMPQQYVQHGNMQVQSQSVPVGFNNNISGSAPYTTPMPGQFNGQINAVMNNNIGQTNGYTANSGATNTNVGGGNKP